VYRLERYQYQDGSVTEGGTVGVYPILPTGEEREERIEKATAAATWLSYHPSVVVCPPMLAVGPSSAEAQIMTRNTEGFPSFVLIIRSWKTLLRCDSRRKAIQYSMHPASRPTASRTNAGSLVQRTKDPSGAAIGRQVNGAPVSNCRLCSIP